jgi:hypothetical protein
MNSNNTIRLFEFIDDALQVQKLLSETNWTLKFVNKSTDLIQHILTYMLKTYIFLYSIVAICLQTLLSTFLLYFSKTKNPKIYITRQSRKTFEIFQ